MILLNCLTCKKQQKAVMDKSTEKVFCDACMTEYPANHFLKHQLKAVRQFKENKQVPFGVKCAKCGVLVTPIVNGNIFSCSECKKELNVTEQYKIAYNIHYKTIKKDV